MEPGYYYLTQNDATRSVFGVKSERWGDIIAPSLRESPVEPVTDKAVISFLDGK